MIHMPVPVYINQCKYLIRLDVPSFKMMKVYNRYQKELNLHYSFIYNAIVFRSILFIITIIYHFFIVLCALHGNQRANGTNMHLNDRVHAVGTFGDLYNNLLELIEHFQWFKSIKDWIKSFILTSTRASSTLSDHRRDSIQTNSH